MRSGRVGNYQVIEQIGAGGMGAVYRGEHAMLGRPVAIKVLLPELSHNQEMVTRFFNEARATAKLQHPGIIDVFDFGFCEDDHSAFIVMELLSGQSLRERMAQVGKMPWQSAISFTRQIAIALAAAHRHGIVHRDLKPDNIFVIQDRETGHERIKVLDFGIAKLAANLTAGGSDSVRTRAGTLMGTPAYMSPQQCRGAGEVDHRADVYSLGCILFEMVCGRTPFLGEGIGDLLHAQMSQPPPAPSQFSAALPGALEATILRALAKPEALRQQTMEDLVVELDQLDTAAASMAMPVEPPASSAAIVPPPATASTATTGAVATATAAAAPTTPPTTAPAQPGRNKLPWILAGGLAAVMATAVIVVIATRDHGGAGPSPAPVELKSSTAPPPPAQKRKPKVAVVQLSDEQLAAAARAPRAPAGKDGSAAPVADKQARDKEELSALMDLAADSSLVLWGLGGDDYLVKNLGPSAALRVESTPSGASVTYDGVVIGKTPLSLSVDRGAYSVEVELALPGYADRTAALSAATDHSAVVELPLLVHLRIASKPPGADVEVNGDVVGKTPLELQLPPSDQPQPVTLRLDKYVDKQVDVPVKVGTTTIVLDRVPQPVIHELDSIPPGVDVVVAGAVVGKTPFRVEFLEEKGKFRDYVLKAPAKQARYRDTPVHVPADKPFKRQIHLQDICAGRAADADSGAPALVNPYDPCRAK